MKSWSSTFEEKQILVKHTFEVKISHFQEIKYEFDIKIL